MVIQVLENRVNDTYLVVSVDVVLSWVIVEVQVVPSVKLLLIRVDYFHQILCALFQVLIRNVLQLRHWLVNKFVFNDGATDVDF